MALLSKVSKSEFDSPVERLLASIANLRQQPTSKGAHFYRTSLRRFEAWSDIFQPRVDPAQKQALAFLEKLRKMTGKLRDREVHLELIDKLSGVGVAEKNALRDAVVVRRDSSEKRLKALLRDPIVARIWRTLRTMDGAPPQPGETPVSHPISGMAELALEEYRAFVQRHGVISAENLHGYRLECKRFRYTAELAGETAEASQLTKIWKEIQDEIGEWHDYLTLTAVARKVVADSSVHSALATITREKFASAEKVIEAAERKLTCQRGSIPKKKPLRAQRRRAEDAA